MGALGILTQVHRKESGQVGTNPLEVQVGTNPLEVQVGTNPLEVQVGTNPLEVQVGTHPLGEWSLAQLYHTFKQVF